MKLIETADYNTDGCCIKKSFNNEEILNEYDTGNHCIHSKSSHGWEFFQKFDDCGNIIYTKTINEYLTGSDEWWYEYNKNGHCIHSRHLDATSGRRLYQEKRYEYTYHKNGKIKSRAVYEVE